MKHYLPLSISTSGALLMLLVALLLPSSGILAQGCVPGETWTPRSVTTGAWTSVTYGKGLYVAVSYEGSDRVMTSPDGINWTARTAPSSGWSSITFGNGMFVAVANSGTNRVMTSPDGINWTAQTASEASLWSSVTYGNGKFVAVAYSGLVSRVMSSPDGVTWTSHSACGNDDGWQSVAYGNGVFVAVANSGDNRVMTSTDGETWTARTGALSAAIAITFGGGKFVGVGVGSIQAASTTNGITWGPSLSPSGNWQSVTYGNGLYVAVALGGNNRLMTSTDGASWTARTVDANQWFSVTHGNDKFVAVSYDGTNRVVTSPSAVTPSVTLASNDADNSITSGTSVTFTATPTNGGTSPTYVWYKNNVIINGESTATYTTTSLANGDKIKVVMTSNAPCASPTTATSDEITVSVTSPCVFTPSNITVAYVGGGALGFSGPPQAPVTYTPNGTFNNAPRWGNIFGYVIRWSGSRWEIIDGNIVAAYSSIGSVSNIPCESTNWVVDPEYGQFITLGGGCGSLLPPTLVPTVSLVSNDPDNSINEGTSVTFTATPTNGGTSPTYVWYKNNTVINGESGATYTTTSLANGDKIKVVMTSSDPCASPTTATSDEITITVSATNAFCISTSCGTYAGTYTPVAANEVGVVITNGMINFHRDADRNLLFYFVPFNAWFLANTTDGGINGEFRSSATDQNTVPLTGWTALDFHGPPCTSPFSISKGTCPACVNPSTFNVTGSGTYCANTNGVLVGLSGSETGVTYQLKKGSDNVGNPVDGTGQALSFGNQLEGTYTVVATRTNGGCTSNMTGNATITSLALPTVQTVTGGGEVCPGTNGVPVGLAPSQSGVTYQLKNGSNNVGSALPGTGSALSFGNQTSAGNYTVVATNSFNCSATMSGSANVTVTTPVGGTASADQTICLATAPNSLSLSGNVGNVTKWQRATNANFNGATDIAATNTTLLGSTIGSLSTDTWLRAVVQAGSCAPVNSSAVKITVLQPHTASIDATTIVCTGNAISLSASPNENGLTYAWNGPGNFSSNLRTPVRSNATIAMSGAYRLTVARPACGFTSTASVSVVVSTPNGKATPRLRALLVNGTVAGLNNVFSVCAGAPVTATIAAISGTSYSWNGPNNTSGVGSLAVTAPTPTISNAANANTAGNYTLRIFNGCDRSTTVNFSITLRNCSSTRLAAGEASLGLDISLAPNPVREVLDVNIKGIEGESLQLGIHDTQGRSLQQVSIEAAEGKAQHRFDLRSLPAGMYLLQAETSSQRATKKVIKVD